MTDPVWTKQMDGTYTKSWTVYYAVYGKDLRHVFEEGVSEKDYFLKKLQGKD